MNEVRRRSSTDAVLLANEPSGPACDRAGDVVPIVWNTSPLSDLASSRQLEAASRSAFSCLSISIPAFGSQTTDRLLVSSPEDDSLRRSPLTFDLDTVNKSRLDDTSSLDALLDGELPTSSPLMGVADGIGSATDDGDLGLSVLSGCRDSVVDAGDVSAVQRPGTSGFSCRLLRRVSFGIRAFGNGLILTTPGELMLDARGRSISPAPAFDPGNASNILSEVWFLLYLPGSIVLTAPDAIILLSKLRSAAVAAGDDAPRMIGFA